MPARHHRHNRARSKRFRYDLALDLRAPATPSSHPGSDLDGIGQLRKVRNMLDHVCEPICARCLACCSSAQMVTRWGQNAAYESILMHRLYIHAPLSPPMRPTLGIQLAPAVVCCSGYLSLTYRSDRGSSAVLVCKGRQRRYAVSMVAGCARARSTRVARLQCHPVSLASRNRQFR